MSEQIVIVLYIILGTILLGLMGIIFLLNKLKVETRITKEAILRLTSSKSRGAK